MDDERIWEIEDGVLIRYLGDEKTPILPAQVKRIERKAFLRADRTRTLIFPNGGEGILIGEQAFMGSSIEEIILPSGLTRIENETFAGCTKLRRIILPPELVYIGKRAFLETGKLQHIRIPSSVALIDDSAFEGSGLVKLQTEGVLLIADRAFYKCRSLKSVQLTGTELIGDLSFAECIELERLLLSEGLLAIGNDAFMDCGRLRQIRLPDSLDELGGGAFWNDKNIRVSVSGKLKNHIEHYYREGYAPDVFAPLPVETPEGTIFDHTAVLTYREEVSGIEEG